MKLDKADVTFSKYIRTRDKWKCQRCKTQYESPTMGLHNSHYFGRGKESTRFDPENCDALCFKCHIEWGSANREEYRRFKINQLGEKKFRDLEIRAETLIKKDRKVSYLIATQLLKELETRI